ncbi:ATP-binding protein [Actinomadura viridis]|uniref:Anti-sigma regulatory factor (Ser/Thr protein kinase) n=1 Tax=Actinomadura viridis TaxID=58110 RepID=A0A931DP14_9ACTN|nr:ATP-binding protein [Actinomadura viridis]MBG6092154.1 anti-sigma regulatory factor (Ser/Thr protein kinase) [Actinomadura viridis]
MLASRAASGVARSAVRDVLLGLGYPHAVGDAQLIIAEMVNNAIAVSPPDSTIRIFVGFRPLGLVVAVWDGDSRMPQRRPAAGVTLRTLDLRPENFDRNGGWGLALIEALARRAWLEHAVTGKWVCALLNV